MGYYTVSLCHNARQDSTIRKVQYKTIQYITMTHITQNNVQHSRQSSILKTTKKIKNTQRFINIDF